MSNTNIYFGSSQLFCMNQNHATSHIFANTKKKQNKAQSMYIYCGGFSEKNCIGFGILVDFTGFFSENPVFYTVKVKNENHLRVKCVKQELFHMFQITVTFFFIINQSISQNQGF